MLTNTNTTDNSIVLNVGFTRLKCESAEDKILECVEKGVGGYACFSNVHTTVMASSDPYYMSALNGSTLTFADGKPIHWYSKLIDTSPASHIPGPDFMLNMLKKHYRTPIRHYFLGSTEDVLEKLISNTTTKYPNAVVAGSYSPPFREMSDIETEAILENIRHARPHLIWVGLGAPKQEQWMLRYADRLRPAFLLGVGAAFDFNAGLKNRAPEFVRKIGLEWLFRLLQEPRRLFGRYLTTNSKFIFLVVKSYLFKLVVK